MPQDTFTIRLLAKELSSSLRGGRINRINQPGKEELSLLIYTQKGTLKLTINANARMLPIAGFISRRTTRPIL